jgi:hypothetical protein
VAATANNSKANPAPKPPSAPDPKSDRAGWLKSKGLTKSGEFFVIQSETDFLARYERVRPLIDKADSVFKKDAAASRIEWLLTEAEQRRDNLNAQIQEANAVLSKLPNGKFATNIENGEFAARAQVRANFIQWRDGAVADANAYRKQLPKQQMAQLARDVEATLSATDALRPLYDKTKAEYETYRNDSGVMAAINSIQTSTKGPVDLGPSKRFIEAAAAIRNALNYYTPSRERE